MSLTEFSPEEQAVIEELEKRTIDCVNPKMLKDNYLFYRFAKARNFNLAEAESMLRKHVCFRQEFGIDTILSDYKPPEVFVKYVSTCMMCFDKEGCSVRYTDLGRIDAKGLVKCGKNKEIIKYYAYLVEQDLEALLKRNKKLEKQIYLPIFDFENFPLATVTDMKVLHHILTGLKAFFDNFPEILKSVIVINAPFYFVRLFAVLKQVLPDTVVKKVQIYGADGWREKLLEIIDADVLPAFLGGNKTDPDGNPQCRTFMKRGEPIPKSYYMKNEKKKLGPDFEKLMILPFCKHEISFDVQKKNSNLVWEYDIKSGDIDFSLQFKGEDLDSVEVISKQRKNTYDETEKGLLKCEKVGTYTLVLDNSYCWIYPKEIYYKAAIKLPNFDGSRESL